MTALPADIARYSTDGVLLTAPTDTAVSDAIRAEHIDAQNGAEREIEMFFVDPDDGQEYLDERFYYQSAVNPPHVGIEVEEALGLGSQIPLAPVVPSFRGVDAENGVDFVGRTRGYAYDMNTERFSVELRA